MDLDKYDEWMDRVNKTIALRNRGLLINTREAWERGVEQERNRILNIIKEKINNYIDLSENDKIIIRVLNDLYNKIEEN